MQLQRADWRERPKPKPQPKSQPKPKLDGDLHKSAANLFHCSNAMSPLLLLSHKCEREVRGSHSSFQQQKHKRQQQADIAAGDEAGTETERETKAETETQTETKRFV